MYYIASFQILSDKSPNFHENLNINLKKNQNLFYIYSIIARFSF